MKTTLKLQYEGPSITVIQLAMHHLICTSGDDPDWWDERGNDDQL